MKNVFVQTNDAAANQVVAFSRGDDGSLETLGWFDTGGRGDGVPSDLARVRGADVGRARRAGNECRKRRVDAVRDHERRSPAAGNRGHRRRAKERRRARRPRLRAQHRRPVTRRFSDRRRADCARGLAAGAHRIPIRRKSGSRPTERASSSRSAGTTPIAIYQCRPTATSGPRSVASAGPTPYGFAFAGGDTLVVTEAFGAEKGKRPRPPTRSERMARHRARGPSATVAARSAGRSCPTTGAMCSRRTSPTVRFRDTRSVRAERSCSKTRSPA